jgi:hypothetical protein
MSEADATQGEIEAATEAMRAANAATMPEGEPTPDEQFRAERYIVSVMTGLLRAAKSDRAHGNFHRGWQGCGMCRAVKLGMAFVAEMNAPDQPPPGGGEVVELPEYEDRKAAG